MNAKAFWISASIGTVLQVAMVVAGHSNKSIAGLFAVGGMGFSLVAGVIYVMVAAPPRPALGSAVGGGALAGAACAFVGILISHLMGDVPATLLALGTVSSAVTGAIGAAFVRLFVR